MANNIEAITEILGDQAKTLLDHECKTIPKEKLHQTGPDHVDTIFKPSNRSEKVMKNLKKLYSHGRLADTGYLSIFPVDQGIEHGAGADFAENIDYFDPKNIVQMAVDAGCSGVASSLGALGMVCMDYADKIPLILKLNHNELLTYPKSYNEIMFASVEQAFVMGAIGVGATIYFGSKESRRQIQEVAKAFERAHELGLFTVLWCYLRNSAFKTNSSDYHFAADLTGQANYLGVTIGADIIKQKLPTTNGGFKALSSKNYGRYDELMYTKLSSDHPIDLCRYQVANCFMGKIALINSGGVSDDNDLKDAVIRAVINKRAGGSGLILGRKAFQKPKKEGIKIIHAVQDVYLCNEIGLA